MSAYINVTVADRIQTVRINRPDKKNALDLAMYAALAAAIHDADANREVRVTFITGTGDSFCSGNDIKDFLKDPPTGSDSPVIRFVNTIIAAEKPIVAAVNGLAIGIGTTMLLHFDLVYASEQARFQMPFVGIGLCPEAGSTFLLPALVGQRRAAELLLLNRMFDAQEAKGYGIVNAVVPAAELESAALKAAAQVAAQPPNAARVTKVLLKKAMRDLVQQASTREVASFVPMLGGAEAKEALTAFMEKRKPDFSRF